MLNQRNLPPVEQSQFAMVQRASVPRSKFTTRHAYKTTFDFDYLIPVLVEEVLPGDDWRGEMSIFARLSTPIFPIMDRITIETFFFFVPNRLVWDNWVKFMGERKDPTDHIDYTVPQAESNNANNATGFTPYELGDYFGLPIEGELTAKITVNALPFRGYGLIWNEWFRDQNLQNSLDVPTDDATMTGGDCYYKRKRNKRHDYFTSALPWPQKPGGTVTVGLAGLAPVLPGQFLNAPPVPQAGIAWRDSSSGFAAANGQLGIASGSGAMYTNAGAFTPTGATLYPANLYANLTDASGIVLNDLRLGIATQHLLEADARGGTRYTELLRAHFGVYPEDARLQRPEYIGGGKANFQTQAIPQTSGTAGNAQTGYSPNPLGALGAAAVAADAHDFSYTSTEHGFIIGLINVTGDITYQRGVHRQWSRETRFEYYWPEFAFLGEQPIYNEEIYAQGTLQDDEVFGYQEAWSEYRYRPSRITGTFRSNAAGTLDAWHLSEDFASLPTLNNTWIQQKTPIRRALVAGDLSANQAVLLDSAFTISVTRPMPMRSTPGLTRF